MLPGNTADKTTLRGFLEKIQDQYGKAERIWIMDRGIPTEEVLEEMRQSDPPENENDIRRFGYSRDKRSDCVQVVIALIVTPEGFPLVPPRRDAPWKHS